MAELIAFVIRSAYDRLPHAFRLEEFFFETADADDGVGGIPEAKKNCNYLSASLVNINNPEDCSKPLEALVYD